MLGSQQVSVPVSRCSQEPRQGLFRSYFNAIPHGGRSQRAPSLAADFEPRISAEKRLAQKEFQTPTRAKGLGDKTRLVSTKSDEN